MQKTIVFSHARESPEVANMPGWCLRWLLLGNVFVEEFSGVRMYCFLAAWDDTKTTVVA